MDDNSTRAAIRVEAELAEKDLDQIRAGMRRHTESAVPWETYQDLNVVLRDEENTLIGAALGEAGRGWLHVSVVWVAEAHRGRGHGRRLMAMLEAEARKRNCYGAYLDTFSYQARPFYEQLGYAVFGTLEDYPEGHARHFMQKGLSEE